MLLEANVVHFVRLLRRAGMGVGPGDMLAAERAVAAIDVMRKDHFYAALHAGLVRGRAGRGRGGGAGRRGGRGPGGAGGARARRRPRGGTPTTRTGARRL